MVTVSVPLVWAWLIRCKTSITHARQHVTFPSMRGFRRPSAWSSRLSSLLPLGLGSMSMARSDTRTNIVRSAPVTKAIKGAMSILLRLLNALLTPWRSRRHTRIPSCRFWLPFAVSLRGLLWCHGGWDLHGNLPAEGHPPTKETQMSCPFMHAVPSLAVM